MNDFNKSKVQLMEELTELRIEAAELSAIEAQRIAAEIKILRERSFAAAILDIVGALIMVMDPEGRILQFNRTCEKVTGYLFEEVKGKHYWDYFIAPDKLDEAKAAFKVMKEEGFPGEYESDWLTKDGNVRLVSWSNAMILEGREHTGYIISTGIDITRRKKAEEALQKKVEELARSNAELEQFAYVASHDLQEPLRMVTSFVQLLAKRYKGKLDADADEFISFAVDGANRMKELINDLLAYSRVSSKGRAFVPTDCTAVVRQVLSNLRLLISETEAVIACNALPTVSADAFQLLQLFQNLISNAIKFRSDRQPQVDIGAVQQEDSWKFFVRDNGIGISPEYFERIFLIFQRLHSKDKYPGTGIGLAICKKVVERHGGRIWVESEPGDGATFYFTLPIGGTTSES